MLRIILQCELRPTSDAAEAKKFLTNLPLYFERVGGNVPFIGKGLPEPFPTDPGFVLILVDFATMAEYKQAFELPAGQKVVAELRKLYGIKVYSTEPLFSA